MSLLAYLSAALFIPGLIGAELAAGGEEKAVIDVRYDRRW